MVKKLSKTGPEPSSSASSSSKQASIANFPSTLVDSLSLPKLVVFDLDYTLWPFWVDTHVTPPVKASTSHDHVKDRIGESYAFYSEVPSILYALRERGIPVGVASRTSSPELAREVLRLLHIPDGDAKKKKAVEFFDHMEIYPGSKITHFNKLQRATGLRYEEMLFFDDEARNKNVETLGVHMHLVRDGANRAEFDNGMRAWRARHGHPTKRDPIEKLEGRKM
ncbi:putative magnesium-dependent phosphatase P8B7.31 [Calycina marina]|uniref:Magnesium-dependent phosphatase P8B7.31 n=1 Tax=Calycina marina TaxID=1763456 RepID=A0A9P7Z4S0_9HELO|nr:putative magnesium-dependent phosphatase P8B7.31 [Calycina marina]